MKIKLPDSIVQSTKQREKMEKIASELKQKDIDICNGFIKINDCYIPYDYKFIIDNTIYHINIGLARGQHRGELSGFLGACVNGKYNNYDEMIEFITIWCKFDYKLIKYDNINFIYVFNKKYKHMFEDNNDLE